MEEVILDFGTFQSNNYTTDLEGYKYSFYTPRL